MKLRFRGLLVAALVCTESLGAITPSEWRFNQAIDVPATGLARVNLSLETLNAARSDLADVRIIDGAGSEVPYLVDRPMPRRESTLRAQELVTALEPTATRITLTTGTRSLLKGVIFETPPGVEFIKAVQVEGSHDGATWLQLATDKPIFRMSDGAANPSVSFSEGVWEYLRLTIDDSRTPAVPFTGVLLQVAETNAPAEPFPFTLKTHDESFGVTRLSLDLGAMNLTVASLGIEATDAVFVRPVTIAVPELADDDIREQTLCTGSVYRIDLNGKVESNVEIPIDKQIAGRELIVLIDNGDSPPLAVTGVHGTRRVTNLVFFAREPGRYQLLSGNSQCPAPRYDLSELDNQLKNAEAMEVRPAPLIASPDYKPPDNLTSIPLTGAKIDLAPWKFRKSIQISKPGAQQVELDAIVLARSIPDLGDLRIVVEDRQLPFLLERPSISRSIALAAAPANDPKKPRVSRWSLKLPQPGIPITRITCVADTTLFQREIDLWEKLTDDRGSTFPRKLGHATWKKRPGETTREFEIRLNVAPVSDTLFLETDNGDNPAIDLRDFHGHYPVTRVVFKSAFDPAQPIWLYYGNRDALSPRYDVTLIADQLFRAERAPATLGQEENMHSKTERIIRTLSGSSLYIFWGVLAIVVVVLLLLISRLLPKKEASEK
jgi:Protein of unknown function (DUF3999)